MIIPILLLFAGLVIILVAAEFFTNGIEEFGRHFSFSQAVVGSIFAAVGTALPETILPLVAIFMYGGPSANDIGIGAILGAPFMLSTFAFFLVGLTAVIASKKGKRKFELFAEIHSIRRDITFFLFMYSASILLPLIGGKAIHIPLAVMLIIGYFVYAYMTFRGESADIGHSGGMYFWRIHSLFRQQYDYLEPPLIVILFQIVVSLSVMVKGAHTFVKSLEQISLNFGMSPLLFSLLLAPIATELPEKFNSVTWTWKGRDTLALGNITGAMVFQATFPVTIGLIYTDWHITGMAFYSAALAIISASAVLFTCRIFKRISPYVMLFGGVLYLAYVFVLFVV